MRMLDLFMAINGVAISQLFLSLASHGSRKVSTFQHCPAFILTLTKI
jgi:hypothetical protein